jgi:glutamine synthetase
MSGSTSRLEAISAINNYRPIESALDFAGISASDNFGKNVFNDKVMKVRLPKAVYKSLKKTIEAGNKLDVGIADAVATAMKDWAIEKGATHYTHVFFPLTGLTAEKHDSFLVPDGSGGALAEFSGTTLIQGEPDASSFPNGGLRETFEARGYTAWDVSSPAYIMENPNGTTLCIPTAFVSWKGEALDKKTPVIRSMHALNKQVQRILALFGHTDGAFVASTAGAEQEYFLVDRNFFFARPDLMLAGRTLFGGASPKGQEFDDHYFGAIPERILAFMLESEHELCKLGIPVKTRHNEVAPGQYEVAPIFETANVATDHQQLTMVTLKRVAQKYGMECLLEEKPFAGINGSGKHLNWAMGSSSVGNLMDPGSTPHDNAQFMVFCTAVIRAVNRHQGLLRAVIASAGNDHRLGANEAPPAILSVYLGAQLTDVYAQIKKGGAKKSKLAGTMNLGVDVLPPLPKDAGDRNRTSPFAFTGNRFEFRAVGSRQSIAGPLVAINTIVAESLDYMATELEKATKGNPAKLHAAVQSVIKKVYIENEAIVFNGDNYTDAWHKEAEKRGLLNLRTSVDALPQITTKESIAMFKKYKVLNAAELKSRQEVYFEQYVLKVSVEAKLVSRIAKTTIYPAATRYQSQLAETAASLKAAGCDADLGTLKKITNLTNALNSKIAELEKIKEPKGRNIEAEARHMCFVVLPKLLEVREVVDALEGIVADDLWPLPTYPEMLFIR